MKCEVWSKNFVTHRNVSSIIAFKMYILFLHLLQHFGKGQTNFFLLKKTVLNKASLTFRYYDKTCLRIVL